MKPSRAGKNASTCELTGRSLPINELADGTALHRDAFVFRPQILTDVCQYSDSSGGDGDSLLISEPFLYSKSPIGHHDTDFAVAILHVSLQTLLLPL